MVVGISSCIAGHTYFFFQGRYGQQCFSQATKINILTYLDQRILEFVRFFKMSLTFFRGQFFLDKIKQMRKVTLSHSLPFSSTRIFLSLNSYLIKSAILREAQHCHQEPSRNCQEPYRNVYLSCFDILI